MASIRASLVVLAGLVHAASAQSQSASTPSIPLVFEANHGQVDDTVRFVARRPGYSVMLAPDEALLVLEANERQARGVRIRFEGARAMPRLDGEGLLAGRVNYIVSSDPSAWHTQIPLYSRVVYRGLYPRTDLVMRGGDGDVLEYDFIVGAGGDPAAIGMRYEGARKLELTQAGDLRVVTAEGTLTQQHPVAYQDIDGRRRAVAARFVIDAPDLVRFEIGAYDHSAPLVIDPPLAYSTFIGGDGRDRVNAIATDDSGHVYVTGETQSLAGPLATDFPTKNPLPGGEQLDGYAYPPVEPRPFPSLRKFDAFVGKLDTTKSGADSLVYMTFFGGDLGDDRALALAVDSAGRAHIGGLTSSKDLPLVNPLQSCVNANGDFACDLNMAFMARLSATGGALEYASFLNGNNVDEITSLAVGAQGALYLAGRTASPVSSVLPVQPGSGGYFGYFPVTANAMQTTHHGVFDAFVMVLDLDANGPGPQLVYSTLLGGCANDEIHDLAVDSQGRAVVTGTTQAPCAQAATQFPLVGAFQATYAGGLTDSFIASIDPSIDGATGLLFSTYLGGKYDENDLRKSGLALDASGRIFVAGTTSSPDFPTTAGAAQRCPAMSAANAASYPCDPATGQFAGSLPPNGAVIDGYVAVLSPAGALLHATYLGGAGHDSIADIAVREDGAYAYVAGSTTSTNLGATCAPQPQLKLGRDAFVATLHMQLAGGVLGSERSFFTYLGGGGDDFASSVAYDPTSESTYVAGYTTFTTSTFQFPITDTALQAVQPGSTTLPYDNGFLAQISSPAACAPDLVLRKFASDPVSAGCGLTYTIEVQNLGSVPATQVTMTDPLPQQVTLASASSTQGSCTGTDTVVCDLGTLGVGEIATITLVASIDGSLETPDPVFNSVPGGGTTVVNTASVASLEPDTNPANNTASWTSHVVAATDSDADGINDCVDACPSDPFKTVPGLCGCGSEDYPSYTVTSEAMAEGDTGTSELSFTITLAQPTCVNLAFDYATAELGVADAALAGADYVETSGSFTVLAGTTTQTVSVGVLGDVLVENDETFELAVLAAFPGPVTTATAAGTIVNDDDPPMVSLLGPTSVAEGDSYEYAFVVAAGSAFQVASTSCGSGTLIGAVATTQYASGGGIGSFWCLFPDGPSVAQVGVQVEAGGAASNVATVDVDVYNVAPVALLGGPSTRDEGATGLYSFLVADPGSDGFALLGEPDCGSAGMLVAGSLSLDPGGSGGSFECYFPNGFADTTVGVAVKDSDDAASAPATKAVAVANVPPTAVLQGPTSVAEGEAIHYEFSFYDPADDASVSDVGCGSAGALVPGSLVVSVAQGNGGLVATGSFDCVFPSGPTTSTVAITAADEAGPGEPAQLAVVIADVAPSISLIGPASAGEGQIVQLTFAIEQGSNLAFAPGFPDCGLSASLVPGSTSLQASGGAFACELAGGPAATDARVQLVDDDGKGSNIAATTIAIENLAPTVVVSGPSTVASGAIATYAFAVTDAAADPFVPSAGFPSCGTGGTLVAGSLAYDAVGGSFQCAFVAGPATSQVSFAVTDVDGGASAADVISVTISAPAQQGGSIVGTGTLDSVAGPVKIVVALSCSGTQGARNLHVTWGAHKLKLEELTGVTCSDDGAIAPGLPVAGFDTITGAGVGRYDGIAGYQVAFELADAGEPGPDRARITIADAQGNVVFDVVGSLVAGNLDAHP